MPKKVVIRFRLTVRIAALSLALAGPLRATEIPPPPADARPGLEARPWSAEDWSNGGTAESVEAGGRKLLKLVFAGGPKEKAAFRQECALALAPSGALRFFIYAGDEFTLPVSFAVCTAAKFQWHETKASRLKKGWNRIEIPVGVRTWKTEASGWKESAPLDAPGDVRAIDVVIYNGLANGSLYLCGIQYDADGKSVAALALIEKLGNADWAVREQAERDLVALGRSALNALQNVDEDAPVEAQIRAASALGEIERGAANEGESPRQRDDRMLDDAAQQIESAATALHEAQAKAREVQQAARAELGRARAALHRAQYAGAERRKACEESIDRLARELDATGEKRDDTRGN